MKPEQSLRFFLGANTPQGFVSRFDQLADANDGWRTFVIKGGPGTGKSTMIQKIAQRIREEYGDVETIRCSSDVDSYDAVIAECLKLSVADGTAPHVGVWNITKQHLHIQEVQAHTTAF